MTLLSGSLSTALLYRSPLLGRPLALPLKDQESPYLLSARIHASQNLNGESVNNRFPIRIQSLNNLWIYAVYAA